MPDHVLLLKASDFAPLWADLNYMQGAIEAQERATVAFWQKSLRQANLADPARPADPPGGLPRLDPLINPQQAREAAESDNFLRLSYIGSEGMLHGVSVSGGLGLNSRFLMLFDEHTNQLLAIVDDAHFRAVRVGSNAGLAVKHLKPDAKVLGMIGSGYQARTQLPAMVTGAPGLERIKVFSPTPANRDRFCVEMSSWLGREVEPVSSAAAAIEGADIVNQVHNGREPLLQMSQIKPGALLISVAGRGQMPPEVISMARMVAPSWDVLARNVLREPYFSAIKAGTYTRNEFGGELGEIIAKGLNPRRTSSEIIDYHVLGVPFLDHAIADWAYGWAAANGAGTPFTIQEGATAGH